MPVQITTEKRTNGTTVTVRPRVTFGAVIAGLLFFAPGVGIMVIDAKIALASKQSLHTSHLLIGGGFCAVGVVVAFSAFVLPPLRGLSVVIAPYVPIVGGRRAGDLPKDDHDDAPGK